MKRLQRSRFIKLISASAVGLSAIGPQRSLADPASMRACFPQEADLGISSISLDPWPLKDNAVELFNGDWTGFSNTTQWTNVMDKVDAFAKSRSADQCIPHVVVHFHGGLVAGPDGIRFAKYLLPKYLAVDNVYPLFFVWHSGPFEAIFPRQIFRQQPPISTADGLLNRPGLLNKFGSERAAQGTSHGLDSDDFENRVRVYDLADGPIGYAFLKDEIDNSFGDGRAKAGSQLIEQLLKSISDGPRTLRVTLVGHSMGSIYATRFIQEFEKAARTSNRAANFKFDVIFLAPAVRFDLFNDALQLGRIGNFRMFAMYDGVEIQDQVLRGALYRTLQVHPVVSESVGTYPHSLLYLISGGLEDAPDTLILGMDRFWHGCKYQGTALVQAVRAQLNVIDRRGEDAYLVLSPTTDDAPLGYRSQSCTHGGFDVEPDTLASVLEILTSGFVGMPPISRRPCSTGG